ncbi:unnamed protein product [Linum tenue]|uniref:RING-type E3 ubiquitin transferase n=1 Tax=Linum tenue TaxID=586396 RepID=A0AAV0JFS6_9ROSI|nr:unnamed protein product [Linum tenue]
MGFYYSPVSQPSPHLYPQEIQLKLYQAFIFSIPILFTIILVLLFYLFYLKRRASTFSSSLPTSASSNQPAAAAASHVCEVGLKEKLQVVPFDEELRSKESQCCVCLGDFEMKEELLQISSCRHVFHMDCIRHWLLNNSTCPICRCFVIPTANKLNNVTSQSSGDGTTLAVVVSLQQNMVMSSEHQASVSTHAEQRHRQEEEEVATSPGVEHRSIRVVEGSSSSQ